MNDEQTAALTDWLRGREAIHDLAVRFPPMTKVRAVEGQVLIAPAPGVIGEVQGYAEPRTVIALATMATTITSPITGQVAAEGEEMQGHCDPDWLEVVEYGAITPADVREAIDVLSAEVPDGDGA